MQIKRIEISKDELCKIIRDKLEEYDLDLFGERCVVQGYDDRLEFIEFKFTS